MRYLDERVPLQEQHAVAIQINAKPLAGFDRPIEMLTDCHRRIEHFLSVLQQVAERYAGQPLDDAGRRAVLAALEYFEHSAPKHTADEEESLFPRVVSAPSPDPEVLRVMKQLEHEHREAERLQQRVHQRFQQWTGADVRLAADAATALAGELQQLRKLYAQHIAAEEQLLFPAAAAVLADQQLRQVGQEMYRRRHGVSAQQK